jgi:hypothetical protein
MRMLSDTRALTATRVARLSADARGLLETWAQAGWVHAEK